MRINNARAAEQTARGLLNVSMLQDLTKSKTLSWMPASTTNKQSKWKPQRLFKAANESGYADLHSLALPMKDLLVSESVFDQILMTEKQWSYRQKLKLKYAKANASIARNSSEPD